VLSPVTPRWSRSELRFADLFWDQFTVGTIRQGEIRSPARRVTRGVV